MKLPLNLLIITKKHYEMIKKPFDSRFKIIAFKGILIVSLCILIVYYFLFLLTIKFPFS